MQTDSSGDSLHEMSILFSGKNKKNINLSSAELAQRVLRVKQAESKQNCKYWQKYVLSHGPFSEIGILITTYEDEYIFRIDTHFNCINL